MKIAGINYPGSLISSLRDGRLVIFAGAGVSFGEPAKLPSFYALAKMIAAGTGETQGELEREDAFLGRLEAKGVDVHARAAQHLNYEGIQPTELHLNLLRLFSDAQRIRLVTTNFDLLFEQAAQNVYGQAPEIFRAPALPLGRDFLGIVHIHGSIIRPYEMVVTDKDFGLAYLTDGWAREFLVGLFHNYAVLFVGYSHNDTVVTYLSRALPESSVGMRYILTENSKDPRWQTLGIEPINFSQADEQDFTGLYVGVRRLAVVYKRSMLDWKREVTDIASRLPPIDDEEADIIEYALSNEITTRYFTGSAIMPEWIDWLDKRGLLNPLFKNGNLSKRDAILVNWLINRSVEHFSTLALCIAKHEMQLNPHLWHELVRHNTQVQKDINTQILCRWVSLLLSTMPPYVDAYSLQWLGESCIKTGEHQSLLKIFIALIKHSLTIRTRYTTTDPGDPKKTNIELELRTMGDYYTVNQLWELGLKPVIPKMAEQLLRIASSEIEGSFYELNDWGQATSDGDVYSWQRSAIEPHEQDEHPYTFDVLIEMARDSLEWLVINNGPLANGWCDLFVDSEIPLFRRLAVHISSLRSDLSEDGKVSWLLAKNRLHDIASHHEVFRAIALLYSKTNRETRESLIESIWTQKRHRDDPKEAELLTASSQHNWFFWLHKADPSCDIAEKALHDIVDKYPKLQPREYPDLTSWMSGGWEGPQSPWSVEELLAKPAKEWLPDLLSFQPKEILGPDRIGLINTIKDAVKQNFEWGINLDDCLTENGQWEVDLWHGLIQGWSEMEPSEEKDRIIFGRLARRELFSEHPRAIAEVLLALVKDGGKPYANTLLSQANNIAAAMWTALTDIEIPEECDHWLQLAINHPSGILAEFWIQSLSIWRKNQQPVPRELVGEYLTCMKTIATDKSPKGKLGRSVLAGQISFLLAVDEEWTREFIVPIFNPEGNAAEFLAVWDGFLAWGRLNPLVAEIFEDYFLKAVQQLGSIFSKRKERFLEYYTTMLCFQVEDPLNVWLPNVFKYGNIEDRQHLANNIEKRIRSLEDVKRTEWWTRWLKRYWEDRVQGVPSPLEAREVESMLNWLPHLQSVFPEAVDVAIRMPKIQIQHCMVIHELKDHEILKLYPESVAKLLLYLDQSSPAGFFWFGAREIISRIVNTELPLSVKVKLEELEAKL